MTPQQHTETEKKPWARKFLTQVIGGALVGGLSAAAVLSFFGEEERFDVGGSAIAAIGVALIYVLMGVFVGVGTLFPKAGAHVLNVEDADELREEKGQLVPGAVTMVLLGAALGIVALAGPAGIVAKELALGVAALTVAITWLLSWRTMAGADELMRAMMREGAEASYYLIFLVLGGWAMLAHLDLASAPAMLDILTAFWGLGLVGTFVACGKHGMLSPRG